MHYKYDSTNTEENNLNQIHSEYMRGSQILPLTKTLKALKTTL